MPLAASRGAAPTADEFELSIFGPGIGECVLVHLGAGNWIIVDSCREPDRTPVALKYLEELGVGAAAIKLVVVTHWHDDHIGGIADVFSAAKNAELVCSSVLDVHDYFQLLRLAHNTESSNNGVEEQNALFRELINRLPPKQRNIGATPQWASANRLLFRKTLPSGVVAEVIALSPSDVAHKRGLIGVADELERLKKQTNSRRVVAQTPNEASIVLLVSSGPVVAILGSDLEETPNPADGWKAIVADHAKLGRPMANILKVPHHGSANADNSDVWSKMMLGSVRTGVLSPFRSSGLPRPEDLIRLRQRTEEIYVTADSNTRTAPKRSKAVMRTIGEVAIRHTVTRRGPAGHIRLRSPLSGGPQTVDVFHGATKVP